MKRITQAVATRTLRNILTPIKNVSLVTRLYWLPMSSTAVNQQTMYSGIRIFLSPILIVPTFSGSCCGVRREEQNVSQTFTIWLVPETMSWSSIAGKYLRQQRHDMKRHRNCRISWQGQEDASLPCKSRRIAQLMKIERKRAKESLFCNSIQGGPPPCHNVTTHACQEPNTARSIKLSNCVFCELQVQPSLLNQRDSTSAEPSYIKVKCDPWQWQYTSSHRKSGATGFNITPFVTRWQNPWLNQLPSLFKMYNPF